ncbi:hypothetical protein HDU96_006918 [Phlyctochytrium bullatum]|nr:hypothetical protein HDU96_006918 [Phlyctochytrium bullatum]
MIKVETLGTYYIIDGTIYQAPDLATIVSNRVLTSLYLVKTAFSEFQKKIDFTPSRGHYFEDKAEEQVPHALHLDPEAVEIVQQISESTSTKKEPEVHDGLIVSHEGIYLNNEQRMMATEFTSRINEFIFTPPGAQLDLAKPPASTFELAASASSGEGAKSNAPLRLPYGMDAILRCVWSLDEAMYNMIKLSLVGQAGYVCRVPMSKDKTIFWPLTINFWGAIEDSHIHLMTHWNFVLHALEGFFLGGSVYPLRDHWVLAPPGGFIIIHGPVRWFAGHTFEGTVSDAERQAQEANSDGKTIPANNDAVGDKAKGAERPGIAPKEIKPVRKEDLPTVAALLAAVPPSVVFMYVTVSVGCTAGLAALLYIAYLKPKLLETKKKK